MQESATIINISINNNDELNFIFNIDALLSTKNFETLYSIVGSLERIKSNIVEIINELEYETAQEHENGGSDNDDDDDDRSDIDKLLGQL